MSVVFFTGKHHLDRRAEALIEQTNEGTDDELLDTVKTALWLGISPQWLEIGRSKGWGPPFCRLSPRRVRYRRGVVKAWLEERAFRSTAEYQKRLDPPVLPKKPVVSSERLRSGRIRLFDADDDDLEPPGAA